MTYPTRAQKEHERWEDEAREKVRELLPDASDQEIIEAVADYLVAQGPYHGGKWHLSILDADKSVEHDWRYKNVHGITTRDPTRAHTWIGECMRLGYCVFGSNTKHGTGAGAGSIKQIRELAASMPVEGHGYDSKTR